MADDDYLSKGGVKEPSLLFEKRPPPQRKKDKEDLYVEGYGREFGGKTTYSVGVVYGLGLLSGGLYGFGVGARKGGSTPKLFFNSVMNGMSAKGPFLANQGAIMTLYYVCSNQFLQWIRGEDDHFNAPICGTFAGALYKSGGTWLQCGRYAGAAGVAFTGIDQAIRRGWMRI